MTRYVAGFLFDKTLNVVALIHKTHPEWQAGRLNGIGGHVNEDETPAHAMRREFFEEAGIDVDSWSMFCRLHDARGWEVSFFWACDDRVHNVQTMESEFVSTFPIRRVLNHLPTVPNLSWLIPMALSHFRGEHAASFDVMEQTA